MKLHLRSVTHLIITCAIRYVVGINSIQAQALSATDETENDLKKLVVFNSDCGESYIECVVADIGCRYPGDFFATMHKLSKKEAGEALSKLDGVAYFIVGAKTVRLMALSVEYSDSDGDWSAKFGAEGFAENVPALWEAAASEGAVSLALGNRLIKVPLTSVTRKSYNTVVEYCRKRK